MQHTIQIERFLAGDQRYNNVKHQRCYHGDKVPLVTVDRTAFLHHHTPVNIRSKRTGKSRQSFGNTFKQAIITQPGVNNVCPVALHKHTGKSHKHTGKQACPGATGCTETAVKTENKHRSATAAPDGNHQSNKQPDVVQLSHETRSEEEKHPDTDRYKTHHPHMFAGSKLFLTQRQDHILTYRNCRTENTRIISGDHHQ